MTALPTHDPDTALKTPMLGVMDAIGNAASAKTLEEIRSQLVAGVSLVDIYNTFRLTNEVPISETEHFVEHWLGSWWPEHNPEEKLRQGIIKVIGLQLEQDPPRKVDYWWIFAGHGFRVVPCVGHRQVTVIILTPNPPEVP